MSARVQKYLAAKAAGSEKGRNLIKGLLGENGEKLVGAIHEFNTQDVGKDTANKLEEALFKVIAKLIILLKSQKIKFSDFAVLVAPTRTFTYELIDACELTSFCYESKKFINYINTISVQISALLKPHVTGKSLERVKMLQTHYGSKTTLDKLFLPDAGVKLVIAEALNKILDELEVKREDNEEKKEEKTVKKQ